MTEGALQRGAQDEPLPDDVTVLRANKLPLNYETGQPLTRAAFDFELSSRDKLLPRPKLSVYARGLTTELQACSLVRSGTTHRLIARLRVTGIRQAHQAAQIEGAVLDVVWDEPLREDDTPDTRAGAVGHCGITGLKRPPDMERTRFKLLQSVLADAASKDYRIVELAGLADAPDSDAGI